MFVTATHMMVIDKTLLHFRFVQDNTIHFGFVLFSAESCNSYEFDFDNKFFSFISLQAIATPISSVVTMVNVFLTATHVMTRMTVETTVMKTDAVCHIMVCIV